MILKLSWSRRNDVSLLSDDEVTRWRSKYSGKDLPAIFGSKSVSEDPEGEHTSVEVNLPDIHVRQELNSQDPLASCYHYLFFVRVILPAILGIRMCWNCSDCTCDETDVNSERTCRACSDCLGSSAKAMGGFAGLAIGLAIATEYQGEATPHGHVFASLANMYQHTTLQETGEIIEHNAQGMDRQVMLDRLFRFVKHVQR